MTGMFHTSRNMNNMIGMCCMLGMSSIGNMRHCTFDSYNMIGILRMTGMTHKTRSRHSIDRMCSSTRMIRIQHPSGLEF